MQHENVCIVHLFHWQLLESVDIEKQKSLTEKTSTKTVSNFANFTSHTILLRLFIMSYIGYGSLTLVMQFQLSVSFSLFESTLLYFKSSMCVFHRFGGFLSMWHRGRWPFTLRNVLLELFLKAQIVFLNDVTLRGCYQQTPLASVTVKYYMINNLWQHTFLHCINSSK